MTQTALSRAEILLLARQAGLDLPDAYVDELVDAYGLVTAMVGRLPRNRARADEPAHVFQPTTCLPPDFSPPDFSPEEG